MGQIATGYGEKRSKNTFHCAKHWNREEFHDFGECSFVQYVLFL